MLEQEVQETEIVSFEVDKDGNINIKLNKPVENARFYLDEKLVTATGSNPYKIEQSTSSLAEDNKKHTLKVTDETETFSETFEFTYRKLKTPEAVTVKASVENGAKDLVNSSNVKNVTVLATFTDSALNKIPVTLELTITDSKGKTVTNTVDSDGFDMEVPFKNLDLSSLTDGDLTLSVIVRDDDGNVTDPQTNSSVKKIVAVPELQCVTSSRTDAGTASLTVLATSAVADDTISVYYVIKEADVTAPTVDEVVEGSAKLTNSDGKTENASLSIANGIADKSYVVYLVATTSTGTKSEMLKVELPKVGATKLNDVTGLKLAVGSDTKFEWTWNKEKDGKDLTEGLKGFKIALLNDADDVLFVTEVGKDVREYDLLAKAKEFGEDTYNISVTVVATNADYTDSNAVESSEVTIEKVLADITLSFDTTTKTLLQWTPTSEEEIENYSLIVNKYKDSKYEELTTMNNIKTTIDDTGKRSFDITKVIEEYGIGSYKFKVTAVAEETSLKVNTTSASESDAYHHAEGMKDLAATVKGQEVTLTGTLLDKTIFDSVTPTYKAYYKVENGAYDYNGSETNSVEIQKIPTKKSGLNAGTKYYFIVVTTVNNITYYSNEVSVTTEGIAPTIPNVAELTYTKYAPTSEIEDFANLSANQITYKDETLYINAGTSTVAYTADDVEVVSDIIAVLSELREGKDKLGIKDNKISTLTLTTNDVTAAKTYNLSKVPADAKVEITGNTTHLTSVKGNLTDLTLKGSNTLFDLAGLKSSGVAIDDEVTLSGVSDKVIEIGDSTQTLTINDVKLTTDQEKLGNVTVTGSAKIGVAGDSAETLQVDSTESEVAVTLSFVGNQSNKLEVTANDKVATVLSTGSFKVPTIEVKGGKVDINAASFDKVEVKANAILLIDKQATLIINDNDLHDAMGEKDNVALVEGSIFKFKTDAQGSASYSLTKGSNEVKLTVTSSKTVTVTK